MPVRLNITIDDDVHERLQRNVLEKAISRFIDDAIRARMRPSREELDAAYQAAAERWRRSASRDWTTPTSRTGVMSRHSAHARCASDIDG